MCVSACSNGLSSALEREISAGSAAFVHARIPEPRRVASRAQVPTSGGSSRVRLCALAAEAELNETYISAALCSLGDSLALLDASCCISDSLIFAEC